MLALANIKAFCEENWVPDFAGTSGDGNSFTGSSAGHAKPIWVSRPPAETGMNALMMLNPSY